MNGRPWETFSADWGPNEDLLLEPPSVEEQLAADWRMLQGHGPPENEPVRVSEEKLREFVLGVLDGSLYLSTQVRDSNLLPVVFLPVALGGFKDWSEEQVKSIGVLYARLSTAFPRSINGHPMFPEVGVLHRDDWARALKAIRREMSRRDKIEI